MFDRENVGVRIAGITHQQMERDDAEIPLTVLSCELAPFTRELAGELHDFVKRTLYTATGAEVNSLLGGCSFKLEIRPQEIQFRSAADQSKPTFTLAEAKVQGIHAKRSKLSTAWTLGFTVTCSPASDKQLGQIVDSYLKMRYLTFADAEVSLFESEETTKRRAKKAGPDGAPAGAADEASEATAH